MTFAPEHHKPMIMWKATYEDGTEVCQFQPDGLEVSTDSVSRNHVRSMVLSKGGVPVVTLDIEPGQKLVYRRRTEMIPGKNVTEICHILGWRQRQEDQIVSRVLFYFESDDRIEEIDGFREDHPWYYAPNFRKFEEV